MSSVLLVVSLRLVMQRKMNLSIGFLLLVLFGLVLGGSAQASLNANALLNQQEENLQELVSRVQANADNSCDLLSNCSAESTCSRLSCPLTHANTSGYGCQEVLPNTNCKDNCPWRNFDFSRSFLRVPGVQAVTEEYITQRQLVGICAQRNLDSLFQKHSNSKNFFRLYFGSVDGTFRIYPGTDEASCSSYDPRTRLWYLTSTTNVKKAVMVLIDSGPSMAEPFPSTSGYSNLATAFNITKSFLNTTTVHDYVNIFTFDNDNVNSSSPEPVPVTSTSTHPDFGVFTAMLSSPNQNSVSSGSITEAINYVTTSSAGFESKKIPIEYLKVIILITDSNAVGAKSNVTLLTDLIKENSISLFLFMFPLSTSAIDASPLVSQSCDARGYLGILNDTTTLKDPLLVLEAYYSFLANIHSTYVNTGIDYSTEYSDFSDVDNQTFTLSKAVFSDGELLGVVGINIFKTKLLQATGINSEEIIEALNNRINSSFNFNASAGIDTTICSNQTSNKQCNLTPNISNIVCSSDIDPDHTKLRELSCCGCPGADKLSLALGLGLGLGIPALILVVALIVWRFRRRAHQLDEFSGSSGEDEDVKK